MVFEGAGGRGPKRCERVSIYLDLDSFYLSCSRQSKSKHLLCLEFCLFSDLTEVNYSPVSKSIIPGLFCKTRCHVASSPRMIGSDYIHCFIPMSSKGPS